MLAQIIRIARNATRTTGISLVGMLLLGPLSAEARILYVNGATGNDSTTYANNGSSTPWRTIGRAAWGSTNRDARIAGEAARAGDTVLVAAGTYSTAGTGERAIPSYYTENEGTPGNPIVFRAVGTVNLTLSSGRGPVIGSHDRDYITWDGFTVNEATARSTPDTGAVVLWFCNGCVLQNLDINGGGDDFGRLDNHTGIRIEQSRNILIRNNRIQNVYTAHNVNNGVGIQIYSSGGVTFENNEIFNCGAGIYLKGGPPTNNDYFTIRYNLIYNIGENEGAPQGSGIILGSGAPNSPAAPARVYQNVLRNINQAGIKIWQFDGVDPTNNPMNGKIVNNTIDNTGYGVWVDGNNLPNAGHVFWNNIVTNTRELAIAYGGDPANVVESRFDSEHNMYFTYPTFAETSNGTTYTLASWRSTFNQDSASPASQSANPLYTSANNYVLQAGSPARNAGIDFLDLDNDGSTTDTINLGAYITGNEVIGRTSGGSTPPPQAPTSLRIITP